MAAPKAAPPTLPLPPLPPTPNEDVLLPPAPPLAPVPPVAELLDTLQFFKVTLPRLKIAPPRAAPPIVALWPLPPLPSWTFEPFAPSTPFVPSAWLAVSVQLLNTRTPLVFTKKAPPLVFWPP